MMIREVTPLDKRRCKVFSEEGFAFVLYRGEIRKYQIEEGGELAEPIYREILEEVLCKRARERVLYLLKDSAKTEAQIRRKLKEGCYPQEAIDRAIGFAAAYHYIDDEAFCRMYVESFQDKKSRRQICYDLRQKGIDGEILSRVMEESPVDEESQIEKLLRKRGFDRLGADLDQRRKTAAYLGRKGFSFEAINRVMGGLEAGDY